MDITENSVSFDRSSGKLLLRLYLFLGWQAEAEKSRASPLNKEPSKDTHSATGSISQAMIFNATSNTILKGSKLEIFVAEFFYTILALGPRK